MASKNTQGMVIINNVRYRRAKAEQMGLLKDGKVVTSRSRQTSVVSTASAEQVSKPRRNGSTDAWAAYAIANGKSADELEGKSRDEIAALFDEDDASGESEADDNDSSADGDATGDGDDADSDDN